MTSRTAWGLLVALAVWLHEPPPLIACGPFFPVTIFTYSSHPGVPLEPFVGGTLGVIRPSYGASYLYVAYRHLIGVGFEAEGRKAIQALWDRRRDQGDPGPDAEGVAIKEWLDVRRTVPGAAPAPEVGTHRTNTSPYFYYLNCPADAYRTAGSTLRKRIERFGTGSREVVEWTRAQDLVFSNCLKGSAIPSPAAADLDPLIRADRDYQIAAAHFYAGDLGAAEQRFAAIGRDPSSPWRIIAPYLVARALVRKATLQFPDGQVDLAAMNQAEAQLGRILRNPGLSEIHASARKLQNLVRFRLHPEELLREAATALLRRDSGPTLGQDLDDYLYMLDHSTAPGTDDLTDWLRTFRAGPPGGLDHSLRRWEESGSLPWLVATLSKIGPGHPKLHALLDAAARIPPGSPAFPSLTFHSLRVKAESGRKDEVRRELDALLAGDRAQWPLSSLNLLLALRAQLVRSFAEFLEYAPRLPSGVGYADGGPEDLRDLNAGQLKAFPVRRRLLDGRATRILNEMVPLGWLRDAAKSPVLPLHLRQEIGRAAWVRAVLLDDHATGKELVAVLRPLAPELQRDLDAYAAAPGTDARRFAAALLMLRFPGMRPYVDAGIGRLTPLDRIDDLRDNWWCSLDFDAPLAEANYVKMQVASWRRREGKPTRKGMSGLPPDPPDFVREVDKTQARDEWTKLRAIGAAPGYLGRQVLEWAKRRPDDPRAAEALHLVVRSTRYGCVDTDTSKLSRAAFQLLHRRYPQSPWTGKTKYWY